MKYLVSSLLMEYKALVTLSTYLSGTHIKIDSKKRCWSFRKKNVIKVIEKIATIRFPRVLIIDPRKFCTMLIFKTPATFVTI